MQKTIITVQNKATLTSAGKRNSACCKPVIAIDIHKTFNSCTDAAEYFGVSINTVLDVLKRRTTALRMYERDENGNRIRFIGTCKLAYAHHPEECADLLMEHASYLMDELEKEKAKNAIPNDELEEYLAWKAEREAKRKAEEAYNKSLNDARELIETLNARLCRRQRLVEQANDELQRRVSRLMETENELHEAEMNLMKLEGKVKA